jgi:hypothetical protein
VKALKIISGGQTGVDRAALDVALRHGIECGGWCPAGRLDEFGKFRITTQFRNYKAAVSLNARCRTSKILMELSSFIQENFAAAPSRPFASVLS